MTFIEFHFLHKCEWEIRHSIKYFRQLSNKRLRVPFSPTCPYADTSVHLRFKRVLGLFRDLHGSREKVSKKKGDFPEDGKIRFFGTKTREQ